MKYHEVKIGGETYKLRLTAYKVQKIEKETGKKLPQLYEGLDSVGEILSLFKRSLSPEHSKLTEEKVAELYDEYVDDGGDYQSFVKEIMEVFHISGFLSLKQIEKVRKKFEESAEEEETKEVSQNS